MRQPPRGPCLQERFAPTSTCFGCGPASERGLRIRSYPLAGEATCQDAAACEWMPSAHHEAFPGMLNGGITGTLLDCHSNWTAAHHLMLRRGWERPPATVTSELSVRFLRPTPSTVQLRMEACVVDSTDDRATVEATLSSGDAVTATSRAVFVAVREGHPAYHRW